jgi:PleD family two-component response regulator
MALHAIGHKRVSPSGKPKKCYYAAQVLLFEDIEMNRDMLSRRLTHRGCEVIFAVGGSGARSSEQPDITLMDMSLPVLDGKSPRHLTSLFAQL